MLLTRSHTLLGFAVSQVYKTLVVMLPTDKPVLVLVSGERTIHLKQLAQALGTRNCVWRPIVKPKPAPVSKWGDFGSGLNASQVPCLY